MSKESVKAGDLERKGQIEHAQKMVAEWFRQNERNIIEEVVGLDPSLKEEWVRCALKKLVKIEE